jgi:hypothetical protein
MSVTTLAVAATLVAAQPLPKSGLTKGSLMYPPFDMPFSSSLVLLEVTDVCDELKLDKGQLAAIDRVPTEAKRRYKEAVIKAETLGDDAGPKHMTDAKRDILNAATPEIEKVLRSEQMRRYQQIRFQQRWREALTDPEVWDALKLTEEQRKGTVRVKDETQERFFAFMRQRGFAGPEDSDRFDAERMERTLALFTPEQRKAWDEMRGEPFKLSPGWGLRKRKLP